MARMSRLLRQFLFRSDSAGIAVPPMDGPLTPNELLTAATEVATVEGPRDMALVDDVLYVAAGSTVRRTDLGDGGSTVLATFDEPVGALCADGSALFAAVVGLGVVTVDVDTGAVETVASLPTSCPTALAARGGTLVLAEGSTERGVDDWPVDLMTKGATGRVSAIDRDSGDVRPLQSAVRYCAGVAFAAERDEVVYSEAWEHRLMAVSLSGKGRPRAVTGEMAAYPGRISAAPGGGYWLSAFAARSYLVEFVLTQDAYRAEMTRTIPQEQWIRPYLRPSDSGLDPLQGGQLKKLGITKPWAPARSYGLVVRLDPGFQPLESYHSRAGGRTHGVVQALEHGDTILVASVGADAVVRAPISAVDELTAVAW